MPIRGLLYFAAEYSGWLSQNNKDVFSSKLSASGEIKAYHGAGGENPFKVRFHTRHETFLCTSQKISYYETKHFLAEKSLTDVAGISTSPRAAVPSA